MWCMMMIALLQYMTMTGLRQCMMIVARDNNYMHVVFTSPNFGLCDSVFLTCLLLKNKQIYVSCHRSVWSIKPGRQRRSAAIGAEVWRQVRTDIQTHRHIDTYDCRQPLNIIDFVLLSAADCVLSRNCRIMCQVLLFSFFLVCVSWTIIDQPRNSVFIFRV